MERLAWVGLGGAAGSMARYLLSGWVSQRLGTSFPLGTLCVNLAGSFLLGAVMHYALATARLSPNVQLGLTVGVLGGFTTYSSFNYEVLTSLQGGAWFLAAANVLATLCGCLAAGLLGQALGRAILGG